MVPVQSLILTMISKILKRMVAMSELWPDLGFYWELRVLRARRAGLKRQSFRSLQSRFRKSRGHGSSSTSKIQRAAQDFSPLNICGPEHGDLLIIGGEAPSVPFAKPLCKPSGKVFRFHLHLRHLNPFPLDLESI